MDYGIVSYLKFIGQIMTLFNIKIKKHLLKKLDNYEAISAHDQLPIIWSKAKDYYVWDIFGNKYIDFTSGICVTNIGHSNNNVIKALKKQLNKGLIYAYNYPTLIKIKLLKELINITPFFCEKVVLFSTGAEAIEASCKIIRQYWQKRNKFDKKYIIGIQYAMHGKTSLAENLAGRYDWSANKFIINIIPCFEENIYDNSSSNYYKNEMYYLKDKAKDIAGIIIESYQGWSARFYNKQWIQELVNFCKNNNILVCFDEIQGGFGRTGKLFAYEHYDVEPDLIVVGKALGGGLPISAILGRANILDSGDELSSTQSGNVLACASAIESIKQIKKILPSIKYKSEILYNGLKKLGLKINGKGLLYAIITNTKEQANDIVFKAMRKGLLLIWTHKNSVKIAPPLNITKDALFKGLNIIKKIIK